MFMSRGQMFLSMKSSKLKDFEIIPQGIEILVSSCHHGMALLLGLLMGV